MHIRGHNGKIYPYLVVNDSGLSDARREERVLQLLRMLNHLLGKHKETSRRFLNMTVARVVAVSPQMRLVQVESIGPQIGLKTMATCRFFFFHMYHKGLLPGVF